MRMIACSPLEHVSGSSEDTTLPAPICQQARVGRLEYAVRQRVRSRAITPVPASYTSQSIATRRRLSIRRVASAISGLVPFPGISVVLYVTSASEDRHAAQCRMATYRRSRYYAREIGAVGPIRLASRNCKPTHLMGCPDDPKESGT